MLVKRDLLLKVSTENGEEISFVGRLKLDGDVGSSFRFRIRSWDWFAYPFAETLA